MYVKEHSNRKNYSSLHLNLSRLLKWMAGKHKMKKYILHFSSWNEIIIQSNCYFWVVFGLFGFGFFFISFLFFYYLDLLCRFMKWNKAVVWWRRSGCSFTKLQLLSTLKSIPAEHSVRNPSLTPSPEKNSTCK